MKSMPPYAMHAERNLKKFRGILGRLPGHHERLKFFKPGYPFQRNPYL